MEISNLQRHVKATDLPLDQLASNHNVPEPEKVKEVSRQFEAVLLRQILADANKPLFGSPLIKNSATSAIYQDMITNQLAEQVSRSGSFGLANSLSHQLGHELHAEQNAQEYSTVGSSSQLKSAAE
jgi:Rod binding domain-containing protein